MEKYLLDDKSSKLEQKSESIDEATFIQGDDKQENIPTGDTRKVWVPPTVEEIKIDVWDKEWCEDDLQ